MSCSIGGAPAPPLCPSAQPDMEAARIIGVVGGTAEAPRISLLDELQVPTPELLALSGPFDPAQIFRFAAHCETSKCSHFDGRDCKLATRVVQILPAVVSDLPTCRIRANCRWFLQEGRPACLRCPQVMTRDDTPSPEMVSAAAPA
jgi:hypothetical protein